jgi:TRAP-type mannitol/chloroaromatic compound transport system substrate-binding protein
VSGPRVWDMNGISIDFLTPLIEMVFSLVTRNRMKNIELLTLKDRVIANLKSQLEKVSNQSDKKPNFKKIYDKKPNFKKKYDKKPKKKKPG